MKSPLISYLLLIMLNLLISQYKTSANNIFPSIYIKNQDSLLVLIDTFILDFRYKGEVVDLSDEKFYVFENDSTLKICEINFIDSINYVVCNLKVLDTGHVFLKCFFTHNKHVYKRSVAFNPYLLKVIHYARIRSRIKHKRNCYLQEQIFAPRQDELFFTGTSAIITCGNLRKVEAKNKKELINFLLGNKQPEYYLKFTPFNPFDKQDNKSSDIYNIVPNEATAIKIAELIWTPIYGESINKYLPFKASLENGIWVVYSTLPTNIKQGSPYIKIQKKDCKVLIVAHKKSHD